MTTLNVLAPVGQMVGGAILGWAATAGLTYDQRFWLAAAFLLVTSMIVWLTSAKPAKRILLPEDKPDEHYESQKKSFGLKQILLSTFGLYLLILIFSSIGFNGFNAQVANILPNVFGLSEAATSGIISLAGVLSIIGMFVAGAWMARSGATTVYTGGSVIRFVGLLALALLGIVGQVPVLAVVIASQILYLSRPFGRLPQPAMAVRFAIVPAGQATGWVGGAGAVGSFLGSLLGGLLADAVGFNAINWMGAIAMGIAVLLLFFGLWPAERKKRAAESAAPEPAV